MDNIFNKINKIISKKLEKGFKVKNSDYTGIMNYGIEIFVNNLFKISIILLISAVLKILTPVLIIALFYGILRLFSFGIHLKKSWTCFICSLVIYISGGFLITHINISTNIFLFLFLLCLGIYIRFAPSGYLEKPVGKEDYIKNKFIVIGILSLYFLIFIYSKNSLVNNAILFSIIIQAINIHPLTYKVLGQEFPKCVEQDKLNNIKKHSVLNKENFYSVLELFKKKEFQLMICTAFTVFFTNFAVTNAARPFTIPPWLEGTPKLPKAFARLINKD